MTSELEQRRVSLTQEIEVLQSHAETRARELRGALSVQLAAFHQLERDVAEAEEHVRTLQLELEQLTHERGELQRFEASAREHLRALRNEGRSRGSILPWGSTVEVWAGIAVMVGVIVLLLYVMVSSLLR